MDIDFLYRGKEDTEWWKSMSVWLKPDAHEFRSPPKPHALMKKIPSSWTRKKIVLCHFFLRHEIVMEKSLFIDDPDLYVPEGYPSPIVFGTEFFPRWNRIIGKVKNRE